MSGIESLLIGRVLGDRYRIEEVIGRGGMGAVYRAVDERLQRQVALKVITVAGTGDPDARERLRARFFREARSAAALPHHPNVVPVYDYGSDETLSLDYIVMELLRGSDLASRLSRTGPPALAASLKILIEAARGLAVGHRQGLIHRDVKPGNIFLTELHKNEVQVRVVDFGIAKLADDEDTLAQLTQDGRVPHSPAYASPEQLRGLGKLTPASDVFSLGAVAYQLLTGERPFTETDRNRLSLGMAVSAPSVRAHNPAVPSSIDAIIGRALSVEPEHRYEDAGEMADELERAIRGMADTPLDPYLAGSTIVTATDTNRSTTARAEDDRTRLMEDEDDRTLLAPPPVIGTPSPPPPRPERIDQRPLPPPAQRATRRAVGGMFVWALVVAVLGAAGLWAWSEMARSPGFAWNVPPAPDTLDIPAPEVTVEEPPDDSALEAFINYQQGREYLNRRIYDSAYAALSRAVLIEPNNPEYRRDLGLALLGFGDPADAEPHLTRAIQLAPDVALPYNYRARARLALGDTAAAIGDYEEYLRRETDPARRGVAERNLLQLRATQQPEFLLGEPVDSPPPPNTIEPSVAPTGR